MSDETAGVGSKMYVALKLLEAVGTGKGIAALSATGDAY